MRRILVENARRKGAQRHGGGQQRIDLEPADLSAAADQDRLLAIHEALEELARVDARQAEVVKLRYFAGLKCEEIAALQGVSEKTVRRKWTHAKAWLFERLRGGT
jgi:RNA polymerase sigma factor (TIGR02999 family)